MADQGYTRIGQSTNEASQGDGQVQPRIGQPSPKDIGAVGTVGQQFAENIAPNTAGLAGGLAAASLASKVVLPEEIAAGPAGWALAGLTQVGLFVAGQMGSEVLARSAQSSAQQAIMGEDKFNAYKQDLADNAQAHPIAAMAGNLATQVPFMGFSAKTVGEAFKTAQEMTSLKSGEAFEAWMKDSQNVKKAGDLLGVALGTGVAGVQDASGQLSSGKDFNLLELGGNMAAGAFMNKSTALTEYIGAKVGGPLGEMLNRNITADANERAAYQKAGLTQQMQEGHNNILSYLTQNKEVPQEAQDQAKPMVEQMKKAVDSYNSTSSEEKPVVNDVAPINEAVNAFRAKAAEGRANGDIEAANAWDQHLDKINAEPDLQKKLEMLQAIDPKHPQVRALTEASTQHDLLGSFDESKLPRNTPDQASAAAIDADNGLKVQVALFNKELPIGKVSPEAMFAGKQAEMKFGHDWVEASKSVGEAQKNIYAAANKMKISGDGLIAMANEYAHTLSDLDKGEHHGFGNKGLETREQLQARIDKIRQQSGDGFKQIENYQKTLARLSQENLKRAFEIGKIDKDSYDLLSTKYRNYVGARKELTELESLGPRRKGSGNNQPVKEFEGAAPIEQRISPSEAVLGQRAQLNVNARNLSVIQEIIKDMQEGKAASKIFSVSRELKPGWNTGGNTMKYTLANGEALYIHSNSVEVAKAMNNLDREQMPEALKMMGKATNFIARMAVHNNPGFWGAGFAYDAWGALQNIATTPIAKLRVEFVKNWLKQVGGSFKSNLTSLGAKDDYWTAEAKKNGALQEGFITSAKKTAEDVQKEARLQANGGIGAMLHNIWNEIGHVNDALFAMPRVAAYRTAIEGGLSVKDAVKAAHDIGPNYANKGTLAQAVGQYKAFATASMAGTDRLIRSFYKDGKFDQTKFVGFVAGSLAANMLIRSRNDSVDKYWRDKWDGDKNWVFAIDRTHAITIPMEFAQRPIHMLTGMMTDATNGKADISQEDLGKVAASMAEAYSPFGSKNVVSALAPTVLEGPIDIASNTSYAGKPIVGAGLEERMKQGLPSHLAFYNSFGKNLMEQAGIKMTDEFAKAGFDKLTPQQATYELDNVFGGVNAIAEGNFGQHRFYKTLDDDRATQIEQAADAAPFNKDMAKYKEQIATQRFEESQRIEGMAKEVFKMPLDEQKQAIYSLADKDPDTAHELVMQLGRMARSYLPSIPKSKSNQ